MIDLEDAAQECMKIARDQKNVTQDCALRIRKLPGWKGHDGDAKRKKKGCSHR